MKLHGSTEGNLIAAIRSAGRLRGKPVHADTIRYWADLIRHARQELTAGFLFPSKALEGLVADLEFEVSQRR
jgi:hypothetical protein